LQRCDRIRTWDKLNGRLGQKQGDGKLRCSEQYAFPLGSAITIPVKVCSPCIFI
jgi:hypothetical protein